MLGDLVTNDRLYRFIDGYYTVEDDGPLIVLTARRDDGVKDHLFIEGFDPYFYVAVDRLDQQTYDELTSDTRVREVCPADRTAVDGGGLLRVTTHAPYHVPQLRDPLREKGLSVYEADVRFVQRYLIDRGVNIYFRVPADCDTTQRLAPTALTGVDDDTVNPIPPRVCTYDIEVLMGDETTSVVTKQGTEQAVQPITAIAAHDSYTDEMDLWALVDPSWDDTATDVARGVQSADDGLPPTRVRLYHDETDLLESFVTYASRFDILTGWNSSTFDTPYLCNRCHRMEVWSVYDWAPTDDFSCPSGDGQWINSDVRGLHCLDAQDAFLKTEYSSLKSQALDYVAEMVLDVGKLDYEGDLDALYVDDPVRYLRYNLIDTYRTRQLLDERNIV